MHRLVRNIFLCCAVFIATTAFGQRAALELVAADSIHFTVSLTGDVKAGDTIAGNQFIFDTLTAGSYAIDLQFIAPGEGNLSTSLYLRKGLKVTYKVKIKDIAGDQFTYGLSLLSESRIADDPTDPDTQELTVVNESEFTSTVAVDSLTGDTIIIPPSYTGSSGCDRPLSQAEFESWMNDLKEEPFERRRRSRAMDEVITRCFTSNQIKELLYLFDFEDYKLDVAVAAYPRTWDQDRYKVITEAFYLSKSREDLEDFLTQQD